MSSYIGLQLRSRQLAGEAHKEYSSTARGVAQPSGRSVALFPSGCLLVRCCGSWWAHRLGQGRLGHKLAWSQAGLVTAGVAGRKEGVSLSGCITCATGSRLAQTSRKGRRLPAQFRIPSRSLPLPMSVGSGVFYCPWLFGPRRRPNLHKNLSGDVAAQGVHWAYAGFGVADSFSQGRRGDAASLHPNMRSRKLGGTGSYAPRVHRGQLVGEANQQYSRNSVAAPRVLQPRARSHSCHQFARWCEAVVVNSVRRPAGSQPVRA